MQWLSMVGTYVPSSTSTNTGTARFWMIGLTVVGKPAATVMTSSPGRSRRSPSSGDVSALRATRFAEEPELTSIAAWTFSRAARSRLELLRVASGREPEVEARVDGSNQLLGVEHAAGVADRGLARHKRLRGKRLSVILRHESQDFAAFRLRWRHGCPLVIMASSRA